MERGDDAEVPLVWQAELLSVSRASLYYEGYPQYRRSNYPTGAFAAFSAGACQRFDVTQQPTTRDRIAFRQMEGSSGSLRNR